MILNAATTIRQLQDRQRELLTERQELLLKITELQAEVDQHRHARSEVLQLVGRGQRRRAGLSLCRHLLTRIEITLSEIRRAA